MTNYQRWLDLDTAMAEVSYDVNGVECSGRCLRVTRTR